MEFLSSEQFKTLSNPGVSSTQLVAPHNAPSARVTVTRVVLAPGASQPRHSHKHAEQIWVALAGTGQLLLADALTQPIRAGDAVRFAPGDCHGLQNDSDGPFIYLSVTTPPIDFTPAYQRQA